MKRGPIPGVNIAHNTASRGYQGGDLHDESTPVSRPLNIAHNTLPQVFARMGLLHHHLRVQPQAELAAPWGDRPLPPDLGRQVEPVLTGNAIAREDHEGLRLSERMKEVGGRRTRIGLPSSFLLHPSEKIPTGSSGRRQ